MRYYLMVVAILLMMSCKESRTSDRTLVYCTPLDNKVYPLEIEIDGNKTVASYKGVENPGMIDLKEVQRADHYIIFEEYIKRTACGCYFWDNKGDYDGFFTNGELTYKNKSRKTKFLTETFSPTFNYSSIDEAEDSIVQRIRDEKRREKEKGNSLYAFMEYRWEYNDLSILLHEYPKSLEYPFGKLLGEKVWKISRSNDGKLRFYYNTFILERGFSCPQVIVQYKTMNQVVSVNQYEHFLLDTLLLDYDWVSIDTVYIQEIDCSKDKYYLVEIIPQGRIMGPYGQKAIPQESIISLFKIENGRLNKICITSDGVSINVLYDAQEITPPISKYADNVLLVPEFSNDYYTITKYIKYKWINGKFIR